MSVMGVISYTEKRDDRSPDGLYHYRHVREWRGAAPDSHYRIVGLDQKAAMHVLFLLLAPTHGLETLLLRCEHIARGMRYDRMEVCFLFAKVAKTTDHILNLNQDGDIVGPMNNWFVQKAAAHAHRVVCAWGRRGAYRDQAANVIAWLPHDVKLMHFGLDESGQPRTLISCSSYARPKPWT